MRPRHGLWIVLGAVVLVIVIWLLTAAYPSFWCSLLGTCNQ